MSQPHSPLLIIGVGNEYRGDDAAGLIIARRLKERLAGAAMIIEQSGDGAALMESWRGAEIVTIIDAMKSGAAPGTIRRFDASAQPLPKSAFRCSTHAFGIAEAIELARALARLPLSLVVYGIEGKNFAAGAGLSAEVEKAASEVARQLLMEFNPGRGGNMQKEKVLVVDDDSAIRYTLTEALRSWGYEPFEASTAAAALESFDAERPSAVLQDVNLPDGSGLDALLEYKKRQPQAIVIMITGNVQLEDTLAALRGGAYDFIGKPIRLSELQVTIRNGIEAGRLRREVRFLRREQERQFSFDQIISESAAMTGMIGLARKVAASEASSVLLLGESGTGKDLVAKAIHYGSSRADLPFVAINCAAIPATLIESELFGHEKGAFTDARARKEGLFEQAQGGTLFLDEIGELELGLQAKLLRVLEEGSFRRVGGLKDLPLDVRVIAASNRDLKAESEAGRFRLDLYYRLSVIQIDLPPLRERGDDVLLLAKYYIAYFNERLRKRIRGLAREVEEIFRHYSWPGNVRELRNVIERVMILEDFDLITANWLPRGLIRDERTASSTPVAATQSAGVAPAPFRLPEGGVDLEQVELSLVRQAMERSRGNQTRAAELLGVSRDQLRYRLKKIEESQPKQ